MSKFCGDCGATLGDAEKFCGKCGKHQEVSAPAAEPVATATTAGATYVPPVAATATAAAPVEKKPMTKKTKIILGAVVAVIVVIFAAGQILGNMNSQESVAERYITALEEEDYDTLIKLTQTNTKGVDVTEETLEPFVRLCAENRTYRETLEEELNEDLDDARGENEYYMPWIEEEEGFLYTKYYVVMPCYDYEIYTNVPDPEISVDGEELALWETGKMTADDKFPGIYTVSGTYEGLTAEEDLTLTSYDAYLYFDYQDIWVSNSNNYPIDVYADGDLVLTLEAWDSSYLYYQPMEVSLTSEMDIGRGDTISSEWDGNYGEYYVYNELMYGEIYNGNDVSATLYLNGEYLTTLDPYSRYYNDALVLGDEIVCVPDSNSLSDYTINYEEGTYLYSYLTFEFIGEDDVLAVAWEQIDRVLTAFTAGDYELLESYNTYVSEELVWWLGWTDEEYFWEMDEKLSVGESVYYYSDAEVYVEISFGVAYQTQDDLDAMAAGETVDDNTYWFYEGFVMEYVNGQWSIIQ